MSCNCPAVIPKENKCPICLKDFCKEVVPIGLKCTHTICSNCAEAIGEVGVPNSPLLTFISTSEVDVEIIEKHLALKDGELCIEKLNEIAKIMKVFEFSTALELKLLKLLRTLNVNGEKEMIKCIRIVAERAIFEFSKQTFYQNQQNLWVAIRDKSCQFMGPAMQEEALKLVLLALEDGSELSRKVLVMFVVQRIIPQFPQGSKTSIGHIIQILYRAGCFNVKKRTDSSSLLSLKPEFREYETLRKEHDLQIFQIATDAGIRFSPEQWSSILYGDISHIAYMQSMIAENTKGTESFKKLVNEFLASSMRLGEPGKFLVSLYPNFKTISENTTEDWNAIGKMLTCLINILTGITQRACEDRCT